MIIIGLIYLYFLVGPSIFVGLGFMLLSMAVNVLIVKKRVRYNKEYLKVNGVRVKKFNEVFSNIIYVKANNYENHFFNDLNTTRDDEMKWNKKYFYNSAFVVSGLYITSTILYISTFATFIWMGHVPTVSMIFTFISIYENIQFAINFLPSLISLFIDILVSSKRLNKFLFAETFPDP